MAPISTLNGAEKRARDLQGLYNAKVKDLKVSEGLLAALKEIAEVAETEKTYLNSWKTQALVNNAIAELKAFCEKDKTFKTKHPNFKWPVDGETSGNGGGSSSGGGTEGNQGGGGGAVDGDGDVVVEDEGDPKPKDKSSDRPDLKTYWPLVHKAAEKLGDLEKSAKTNGTNIYIVVTKLELLQKEFGERDFAALEREARVWVRGCPDNANKFIESGFGGDEELLRALKVLVDKYPGLKIVSKDKLNPKKSSNTPSNDSWMLENPYEAYISGSRIDETELSAPQKITVDEDPWTGKKLDDPLEGEALFSYRNHKFLFAVFKIDGEWKAALIDCGEHPKAERLNPEWKPKGKKPTETFNAFDLKQQGYRHNTAKVMFIACQGPLTTLEEGKLPLVVSVITKDEGETFVAASRSAVGGALGGTIDKNIRSHVTDVIDAAKKAAKA